MLINSLSFLVFFAIVVVVYFAPTLRSNPARQNLWLLLTSYVFYSLADWRMVPLLFGATAVFYVLGIAVKRMMDGERWKMASRLTTLAVALGVALLLFFKYLDFFGQSFAALFTALGLPLSWSTLHILVPVGVSFFTFKLISYVVEIHRERIEPTRDFVQFATFIAFFPTIMSGPIDRPGKFLPQLSRAHVFDEPLALDGCRQVLWGIFTKMCIADNLALLTSSAWEMPTDFPASRLLVAALLFPLQMYADFAGYSDMAIGVAKVLGFRVERNFNHPYLARNVAEYWRRWHMSLTSWITDYVFMPLNIALRDRERLGTIIAVMINLVVIGLWHGANWTYALFGFYHGLLFIPLVFSGSFGRNRKLKPAAHGLPKGGDFIKMLGTYCLVAIGLLIFQAPSLSHLWAYVTALCSNSLFTIPSLGLSLFTYVGLLMLVGCEWLCRDREHPLQFVHGPAVRSRAVRWVIYYVLIMCIFLFQGETQQFIYFQF